jgi:hypothetical protein
MKQRKIIIWVVAIILLLCIWVASIYATATTAKDRKSPYLPWQGVPEWKFDQAHNVGGNDPSGAYLPDKRFSVYTWTVLTNNWVVLDSITGLYWESDSSSNYTTCTTFNNGTVWNSINTNCNTQNNGSFCDFCGAIMYCDTLEKWWFSDWRLPSPLEFQTLNVLYKSGTPYYDTNFFNIDNGSFRYAWTNQIALPKDSYWNASSAWLYSLSNLEFRKDNVYSVVQVGVSYYSVICVRGPVTY